MLEWHQQFKNIYCQKLGSIVIIFSEILKTKCEELVLIRLR